MGTSVCPTRRTTSPPFIHDGRQRRAADRGGHPPRAAPPRVRDPVRLRPPSRRRQLGRALPLAPRARPSGLRRAPAARRWGRRARRPVTDAPTRSGLPPPPPSRPRACGGRRAVGATPMSCGAARSGRGGARLGGRGRSPARPGGGAHGRGGGGAERPARRAPAARRRRARVDARRDGVEVARHGASWRLASERHEDARALPCAWAVTARAAQTRRGGSDASRPGRRRLIPTCWSAGVFNSGRIHP